MRRRFVTYLASLGFIALIAISAAARDEMHEPAGDTLVFNLDSVVHIYPDESYLKIIDSVSNVVVDDAGSMSPFFRKLLYLRSGADDVVSILHLGDSHVQGEFWDARLRELFQSDFGNAGRGLIVPHKLSGSNEARDYAITTKNKLVSGRATSRGLIEKLGFTGVAVGIESSEPVINIWSKVSFNSITVLHHYKAPLFSEPDSMRIGSYCTFGNSDRSTRIVLLKDTENIALTGHLTDGYNNPTVYGFSLENGSPGVLLHAAGVNSAAFEHFERNTDFTDGGAKVLAPDLIILSLGTNNCYGGNYKSFQFRETAENFVKKVRDNYPGTAILLTTPMEGCRRYRRTYTVNKNVADVASVLMSVARDLGVACWDMYTAAGGENSSRVWYGRKLMQSDRLHLTQDGYALQGDMLYDAMMRAYNGYISRFRPDNVDAEVKDATGTLPTAVPEVENSRDDVDKLVQETR